MKQKSDSELQKRANDLAFEFTKPEYSAIQDELRDMRGDLLEKLAILDLSTEIGRIRAAKFQGQIELIDIWLTMPEKTSKLLEITRSAINGIGDFLALRKGM